VFLDEDVKTSHTTGATVKIESEEIELDHFGNSSGNAPITDHSEALDPPSVFFRGSTGCYRIPRNPKYIKTNSGIRLLVTTSPLKFGTFNISDITVTGGTIRPTNTGNVLRHWEREGQDCIDKNFELYLLEIKPEGQKNVVITINRNSVTGTNNKVGPSSPVKYTVIWDDSPPTLTIDNYPKKINNTNTIKVGLKTNENVVNFDQEDIAVSGGKITNQLLDDFIFVEGSTFGINIKPDGGKNIEISVGKNAFQDLAGFDGPTAKVSATIVWDSTPPDISEINGPDGIKTKDPVTVTIIFSEPVTGFEAADVIVIGDVNNKKTFTAVSATEYRLSVTPIGGGEDLVVTTAAESATDGVNLGPTNRYRIRYVWDDAPPTMTISGLPDKINSTSDVTATFTFDEAVTGFDTDDITVINGTKKTFAGSGKTYTLVITPEIGKNLMVTVRADAAYDELLNAGPTSAVSHTSTWDATPPTVTISDVPSKINSNTQDFTATFTFSEAVTDFDADDVTVTGGMKGMVMESSSTVYTLKITPTGDANVMVTVVANAAFDGVNYGPITPMDAEAIWDDKIPTVIIQGIPPKIADRDNRAIIFRFNDLVTDFNLDDVTVTGGKKSPIAGAPGSLFYVMLITPDGDKNVVVTVKKDAVYDGVNRGPVNAVTETAIWDVIPPSVSIQQYPEKINSTDPFSVDFIFSEAVTQFDVNDIMVTGGSPFGFLGQLDKWSVVITPEGDKNVVVTVKKDAAFDGFYRGPASADSVTVVWDDTVPTVQISGIPRKINSSAKRTATFTFSEAVTDFDASDITVSGGNKGDFSATSATVYTLNITPLGDEDLVVTVKAGAATDGANTGPASAVSKTSTWDATAPTVTISGLSTKHKITADQTVTFTFSEDVTDFDATDITVTGGAKKNTTFAGSGKTYTLDITPTESMDLVVTVVANVATDGLNTGPVSAVSKISTWDATAPTVTISGLSDRHNTTTDQTATFTFSEDVTGFDATDIEVTDGTKGTFSATSATVYTLVITPTSGEDLVVIVAKDAATDGLNTGPATAQSHTSTWDNDITLGDIQKQVSHLNFVHLLDLTGFLQIDKLFRD